MSWRSAPSPPCLLDPGHLGSEEEGLALGVDFQSIRDRFERFVETGEAPIKSAERHGFRHRPQHPLGLMRSARANGATDEAGRAAEAAALLDGSR
jgi:hypothetical protein